ncbi:unnamed protein product [Caenorhabditis auriculariae]|uniref:G-protein coupled receptors family 1 profile domain-containing protein n=1 Tax=Caenorhabditis auriculariae TaxID=2777116 RepID=A0A8S1HYS8_9PELO|nr:unnamed protein product [Caenorhabditis auriculariae]
MITNEMVLGVNVFLMTICVLQITSNLVVLLVWSGDKRLMRNDNLILLVSLAFIDFVYASINFPYLIILFRGWVPSGKTFEYNPRVIVPLFGPAAALMKSGCTVTTAIAVDRVLALCFPAQYYRKSKKMCEWSIAAFVLALTLAFIDWILLQILVDIREVPGCASFGCFTNKTFRVWWGLSNMVMNLLSFILTLMIMFHLCTHSSSSKRIVEIEKSNFRKIDKSANRVALYILMTSALIGVVPGCLNGVGTLVELKWLDEVSFFVGTCATLSGLAHAFIFAMAHRDIKSGLKKQFLHRCIKPKKNERAVTVGWGSTGFAPSITI